jgi:DNA-binding transcriptional LysR family regulator
MVASGAGFTVLPSSALVRAPGAPQLKFAPLESPTPTRRLMLAAQSNCQSPRAVERVEALVREEVKALVAAGAWSGWLLFDDLVF